MPGFEILAAAITGLITGAIGSLVAPWVNWRVERLRERIEYRRQQVQRWRQGIDAFDFKTENFADTVIYAELRPYLNESFRQGLESGRMLFAPSRGRGDHAVKHQILDAITECERAWGLI